MSEEPPKNLDVVMQNGEMPRTPETEVREKAESEERTREIEALVVSAERDAEEGARRVKDAGGTEEEQRRAEESARELKDKLRKEQDFYKKESEKYRREAEALAARKEEEPLSVGEEKKLADFVDRAELYKKGVETHAMKIADLEEKKAEDPELQSLSRLKEDVMRMQSELKGLTGFDVEVLKQRRSLQGEIDYKERRVKELDEKLKEEGKLSLERSIPTPASSLEKISSEENAQETKEKERQKKIARAEELLDENRRILERPNEEWIKEKWKGLAEIEKGRQGARYQIARLEDKLRQLRSGDISENIEVEEPPTQEIPMQAEAVRALGEEKEAIVPSEKPKEEEKPAEPKTQEMEIPAVVPEATAPKEARREKNQGDEMRALLKNLEGRRDAAKGAERSGLEKRVRNMTRNLAEFEGREVPMVKVERAGWREKAKHAFGKFFEIAMDRGATLAKRLTFLANPHLFERLHKRRMADMRTKGTVAEMRRKTLEEELSRRDSRMKEIEATGTPISSEARRVAERKKGELRGAIEDLRAIEAAATEGARGLETREEEFEKKKAEIFAAVRERLETTIETATAKSNEVEEKQKNLFQKIRDAEALRERARGVAGRLMRNLSDEKSYEFEFEKVHDRTLLKSIMSEIEISRKRIDNAKRVYNELDERRKKFNREFNLATEEWQSFQPKQKKELGGAPAPEVGSAPKTSPEATLAPTLAENPTI